MGRFNKYSWGVVGQRKGEKKYLLKVSFAAAQFASFGSPARLYNSIVMQLASLAAEAMSSRDMVWRGWEWGGDWAAKFIYACVYPMATLTI